MKLYCVPEGVWPKGQVDGSHPSLSRVEELFPCNLVEITDSYLCNAVVEVGVETTEGEVLSFCTATVLDGIVGEASIVAVVVEDADAMLLGKVFKRVLSIHHFFRGQLHH